MIIFFIAHPYVFPAYVRDCIPSHSARDLPILFQFFVKKTFYIRAAYRAAIRLAPVAIGFANTRQNDDVNANLKNFDNNYFNLQCHTDLKNFQGGKL